MEESVSAKDVCGPLTKQISLIKGVSVLGTWVTPYSWPHINILLLSGFVLPKPLAHSLTLANVHPTHVFPSSENWNMWKDLLEVHV